MEDLCTNSNYFFNYKYLFSILIKNKKLKLRLIRWKLNLIRKKNLKRILTQNKIILNENFINLIAWSSHSNDFNKILYKVSLWKFFTKLIRQQRIVRLSRSFNSKQFNNGASNIRFLGLLLVFTK